MIQEKLKLIKKYPCCKQEYCRYNWQCIVKNRKCPEDE